MNILSDHLTRRRFFAATSAAAVTAGSASCVSADATRAVGASRSFYQPDPSYNYQVQRSDAAWRAMLTPEEFGILRQGATEVPRSSPLWNETRNGAYSCKGCDLKIYDSRWKTVIDKGFAFFFHSEPNAVMTDIDGPNPAYGMDPNARTALTEVHCRRCGSHLGHHLIPQSKPLHCINGKALQFRTS